MYKTLTAVKHGISNPRRRAASGFPILSTRTITTDRLNPSLSPQTTLNPIYRARIAPVWGSIPFQLRTLLLPTMPPVLSLGYPNPS